jgi:hypothetical protein
MRIIINHLTIRIRHYWSCEWKTGEVGIWAVSSRVPVSNIFSCVGKPEKGVVKRMGGGESRVDKERNG